MGDTTVTDIAGIDVGLTLLEPTSGVCRSGDSGDLVQHTYCDYLSRAAILGADHSFAAISIDAPLLPGNQLHYEVRGCEKMFVWGAFQVRCKPGESHIRGTGRALRRAGAETAHTFRHLVKSSGLRKAIPRVIEDLNIVEAFPSGYLGVCLPETCFTGGIGRSQKFDWLYDQWLACEAMERLRSIIGWPHDCLWEMVMTNRQHDERAALVCALTAVGVLEGRYVAVGESMGGYFFLPPWELWERWAKDMLNKNRRDPRLNRAISIWIDGEEMPDEKALPE